ncbi:MAG: hypothetical protein BGP13_12425 [Sphingobacteriales bacterium 40-81]|nr:MAG: hypothetical protein BGP13_12425 [Sphingobacteriales bacterium 40-81]
MIKFFLGYNIRTSQLAKRALLWPLNSSEAFRFMEHFAYFNNHIHNSIFRDAWFAFKNISYENHVWGIICVTLNKQK